VNGTQSKIEIFKPFGEAFELMKKILFQPFNIKKWFIIGFAAFLAGHFAGGGFTFPIGNFQPRPARQTFNPPNLEQWKPWLPLVITVLVLVFVAFILVLNWLKARGTFIFTDCIVRNRAAIAEPWHTYRKEGNSYFLFLLAVAFGGILIMSVLGFAIVVLGGLGAHFSNDATLTVLFIILGVIAFLCWILFCIAFAFVAYFSPVVMYIRRCRALDAFREVARLIVNNPVPFILFALFSIVLLLGVAVAGAIISCATCCLAALPA
jgi:hypothetical protein